jgi:serine/threonine protein kinase
LLIVLQLRRNDCGGFFRSTIAINQLDLAASQIMTLSAGDKVGPYEIILPVGAGGMGEVWKARDTRLDRPVAVKLSQERFNDRFQREARAIASLNHPNVCQIYDVGPNYLVMEYLEGTPLKGPLPLYQALKYARQICEGLTRHIKRESFIAI